MATSSQYFLFLYACAVTLVSVFAAEICSKGQIPAGCQCFSRTEIACSNLDKLPPVTNLTEITVFFFSNCNFKDLSGENNVPGYTQATVLSMKNCKIEKLDDRSFLQLPGLEDLILDGNNIKNISKIMMFIPQLKFLSLSFNRLSSLSEDVFSDLSGLEKLHLDKNSFSTLPENIFKNNNKLYDIDLSFNQFTEIPKAVINRADTLTRFVFSKSNLGPLQPNMFKDLPNLKYLDLGTTGAKTIDTNAFTGLSQISFLRLSYNQIEKLPKEVFTPIKSTLRELWLDNNELRTLENGTLPTKTLLVIHLGHNPWHCDKKIAWIKDLHLEKIDQENVTCTTPEALAGLPLANVTRDILSKQPEANYNRRSMIVAAIVIPIIALCVLGIMCIVLRLYQNRRNQKRAQVRYSAVYRDTVESSRPGQHNYYRPTSNI